MPVSSSRPSRIAAGIGDTIRKMRRVQTALVTGSSGLIGSEASHSSTRGAGRVLGVDNNMRRDFFGETRRHDLEPRAAASRARRLRAPRPRHPRPRHESRRLFEEVEPDLIVHCAAQPSHDLAAARPFDDFDVNARRDAEPARGGAPARCPESPFVFLSTNKVYGDAPNELPLVELETRWDYADPAYADGIDETMRIDATMHSLFGASKVGGRRDGAGVRALLRDADGLLPRRLPHRPATLGRRAARLPRLPRPRDARGPPYRIFGYKGKQVRDNIHSLDVCTRDHGVRRRIPRPARSTTSAAAARTASPCSRRSTALEELSARRSRPSTSTRPRRGDHICYISDLALFRSDYPQWEVSISLEEILDQLAQAVAERLPS